MQVVHFKLFGKFAHFLKAEANVSMPSYPFPTRTNIIGLIGAMLGLGKDTPQTELEPAFIAITGKIPKSFWVGMKFHQSLPAFLNYKIKKTDKGNSAEITNQKILKQEWLFKPEYELWVALPEKYQKFFFERIKYRKWHFQPYLGISEHMADIEWLSEEEAIKMPEGECKINSIFSKDSANINMDKVIEDHLKLHFLRMPATLNSDRIFSHKDYLFEREGRSVFVKTSSAYKIGNNNIIFL